MCIMVAGHPGPCYTTASGGGFIGGVLPWPDPRNAEIARLTAERDEARAEVDRLTREREDYREKRQNEVDAAREEVRRLTHAARLVIKEHSCGDINACSVCGPLESALAGKGEKP